MSIESALVADFSAYACEKLRVNLKQIARCAGLLTTAELWQRSNAHCNSVANLILHLTGNVRQWILAGIAGESFDRDRPSEFAARDGRPAQEILPPLEAIVERACAIIVALDADALAMRRTIQGYAVMTQTALFHVVEHFSFHTGQIVHMTKVLKHVELSLFDSQGRRLSGQASPA